MSKFENNLSQGNVIKQLILFSIPFIISNLIQSLYNVADMVIVGQFCGTVGMSGVNIGGQLTFLITNLVIGLSVGATVMIGQYLGSGKKDAMEKTIGTLFTVLFFLAIVLTVFMVVFRTGLLKLIKTPEEAFSEAKNYLLITALGTIFIFGYNALSAIMRGMGDSKNPLIFVAISCAVNIVLDLVLVAGCKMGAAGAAIATIVSQAISMLLCIIYLARNNFIFDFKLSSFRIHKDTFKMLMKVGIPTSVQNVITNVSFLILTAMVNSLGVTASAAVGAVGKFNSFGIMPAIAMSASISAMVAQNLGAGEEERAVKTTKYGLMMGFGMSAVVFIFAQLFPSRILSAFANDPALIETGTKYMRFFCFDYLVVPIVFSFNGLFTGAGHTTFSLINNVLSAIAIRVPAAYIMGFAVGLGLPGIGMGAPMASIVAMIVGLWFYKTGKWKKVVVVHR
ncbi:MAG: MATE family efflux transporter [Clostridia bacterium]|nr:MATE family efflux transporter [Clostridia bacterium]